MIHPAFPGARRAIVATVDPVLAEHLATLHPGVRPVVPTRLPGTTEGNLRDTDALLVLLRGRLDSAAGVSTTSVYVSTDPDDPQLAERVRRLHASQAVVLPEPGAQAQLRNLLHEHLD